MYTNLVLFRNELKNKNVSKYKLIGITTELILSRVIFKKNSDISEFVQEIFSVSYKDYILKSRTTIVAHTCRLIVNQEDFKNKDKLLHFVNKKIEEIKSQELEKEMVDNK